jgi:hypothetical protein
MGNIAKNHEVVQPSVAPDFIGGKIMRPPNQPVAWRRVEPLFIFKVNFRSLRLKKFN